jgi:hypothetical protein
MKRFVRTKRELADCLGVSRPVIYRILNRYPNPGVRDDGSFDVRAWRQCVFVHFQSWQRRNRYR